MKNNIPSEYQSFETLTICSNTLIGVGAIIKIGDVEPLLVGKGLKFPAIWLRARVNKNNWISVVEQSVSLSPQIEVINDIFSNATTIKAKGVIIIKARQRDSSCSISNLDLRPLGINVVGNEKSLNVGGSELSRNTMQGIGTFIGMNDK
ncbi:MAG: hypothetical protein AB9834_00105 [Lentimicrobium sp.]